MLRDLFVPSGPGARACLVLLFGLLAGSSDLPAQPAVGTRCFALELYYHSDVEAETATLATARRILSERRGVSIVGQNLTTRAAARERLQMIKAGLRLSESSGAILYGLNQAVPADDDEAGLRAQLSTLLRMDVYVRSGCPHCGDAKAFLPTLQQLYPGLEIVYHDLVTDPRAAQEMQRLVQHYRQGAVTVPVFHYCGRLVVGFDRPETTGTRLQQHLDQWSYACPPPGPRAHRRPMSTASIQFVAWQPHESQNDSSPVTVPDLPLPVPVESGSEASTNALPLPDLPDLTSPGQENSEADVMDLPVFGRVSASKLGLPLFTIAVGLIDGFNPCAMWVLIFLLSILVNLRDRWRILAVAGTFVLISGLAYFAFMAAWLNVFLWIGYLRSVQITLALLAIFVGAVHIKDFFAFHRGLTLSIPESAKSGIYGRVRGIVMAEHMTGALMGAVVLAVLVNIVELLCTAGLPALYTAILTRKNLPNWQNYAYLGLYNLAYMFDDSLMIAAVVTTLRKTRLQETQGRWLKLVSGLVILALGLILLFRPDWLV